MPINFVAKAAITVALTAANMALSMTRKIEGPRLDDVKVTGADYGTPLYMLWGMRRLEVPIFWAEELREVKRRRKTKGGKFNEYSYFGTWAVAVAGHEIAGIRRIWFDTHLVYDVSGAGPVTPFDFGATGTISDAITIYLGTETQEPDPRIQATVEAAQGADSCPAYRGTAYIVFKDIPLEKLGNRIPQVSVEALGLTDATYPFEQKTTNEIPFSDLSNFTFSPDKSRIFWATNSTFEMWDLASRSQIFSGSFPEDMNTTARVAWFRNGKIYHITEGNTRILSFNEDGLIPTGTVQTFAYSQEGIWSIEDGNGNEHWGTVPFSSASEYYFNGALHVPIDEDGLDWAPTGYLADSFGDVWAYGRVNGTTSQEAVFKRLVNTSGISRTNFFAVTLPVAHGRIFSSMGAAHYADETLNHFVVNWSDDYLYTIDIETQAITQSRTFSSDIDSNASIFGNLRAGDKTVWLTPTTEISLADLTTVRTVTLTNWTSLAQSFAVYDAINNALICCGSSTTRYIIWRYLDRIDAAPVTLNSIVSDVADWAGVADYSFTALDQTINGWSATRGAASGIVEPLLDAYDSDVRPHDWQLQGVKRAGVASGSTLATNKFVGQPRYTVQIKQAAELPLSLTVDYADINADQQPNSARVSRPLDSTDAKGEGKLDLTTLVLDADEAIQLTGRYFRRMWNERKRPQFGLTAQNLALEPADVRTIELDGDNITARATRILIKADDTIQTEWRYDAATLATLDGSAGAGFDGREPSTVVVPLLSKGFVLDIPYLSDVDDNTSPLLYVAAAPYADGTWPGATIYEETGGEYTEEFASVASTAQATWGYVAEAMPDASPNVWDRGTEITVTLQTGTLSGCTEAAALASPTLNMAAIGVNGRWEIVQFTNATLVSGKTYTVSGFLRGRRGTEWASPLHEISDQFLLLDTAQDEARGLSDVGTAFSFKAITSGRTDGFAVAVDFDGNSLRPYAPCNLEASKDSGTGDWALSWTRRTRVGGAWTSGTSIPLGETVEEYEVEILNGSTVVRTITGLTSASATYTAAQQTTDFGAPVAVGALDWRVYQISASVDRGFAATGAH